MVSSWLKSLDYKRCFNFRKLRKNAVLATSYAPSLRPLSYGANVSLLGFLLIVLLMQPVHAEQSGVIQTEDITVLFDEPLRAIAQEAARMFPSLKAELEETLGWRVEFRPTIVLLKNHKAFQQMTDRQFIVAFAVPEKKLAVIDYSRMNTDPPNLWVTLKHELCHLLLHHHITKVDLPKWLDEGVSQWVSDGFAEIARKGKGSVLKKAILSGNLIDINALTNRFPEDRRSLLLAYEESRSLVEYIVANFGRIGILDILKHMKEGRDANLATLESLSVSLDELEEKWRRHLRQKTTWFRYLTANLYQILFFLAALMTIYGFVRQLIRKRAYKDEADDLW